jgi:hypothetical protein
MLRRNVPGELPHDAAEQADRSGDLGHAGAQRRVRRRGAHLLFDPDDAIGQRGQVGRGPPGRLRGRVGAQPGDHSGGQGGHMQARHDDGADLHPQADGCGDPDTDRPEADDQRRSLPALERKQPLGRCDHGCPRSRGLRQNRANHSM